MKSRILLLCLLAAGSFSAKAQWRNEWSYLFSIPIGDFTQYGSVGPVGLQFQFRKQMKNPQLEVGGALGWHYFVNKMGWKTEIINPNEAITGDITNFTNLFHVMPTIRYKAKSAGNKARPYAGLAAGMVYQIQQKDIGLYTVKSEGVQFSAMPEVGVAFPLDYRRSVVAGLQYWFIPAAGELTASNFIGIKLGMGF